MGEVKDDEAVIVRFLTRDAYARPSCAGRDVGVVNSHIRSSILYVDETIVLCRGLIHVCNVAVCRVSALADVSTLIQKRENISYSEEIKHGKERSRFVVFFKRIASCAEGGQSREYKEC